MMPLFSGAFLLHACRTDSGGALRREEGFSSRVKFKGADSNKGSNKVHTSRLVLLAVLVGFAFGVMRAISLSAGGGAATDVTLATVCGVLGGGVLLLVTALFYRREDELYLACQVSFPLLAMGFLLLPQFIDGAFIPVFIFTIGHSYFYYSLWVFCTEQARFATTMHRPKKVFAGGLLAFLGSSLIGVVFGIVLLMSRAEETLLVFWVSIVAIYLFVIGFAFLFIRSKRGFDDDETGRQELFEEACDVVADEGKLSPREAEVLKMVASGFDRAGMREALGVSDNTIKTHVRRIYLKLGVHSKREVSDLVEAYMARIEYGMNDQLCRLSRVREEK